MSAYQTDLLHALQLADIADGITTRHFRSTNLRVSTKPDNTPLSEADTEVEARLSAVVRDQFHEHYLGEEGTRDDSGERRWIVDPIDGTKNFIRNNPVWGTLIALTDSGQTVAAVVSAPALNRRWWAAKGAGAFTQDADGTQRRLKVSKVAKLTDAFVLYSSLFSWDEAGVGHQTIIKLLQTAWRHRAFGDFWNYMLVAEGAADVCLESNPKEWDVAAPGLIIQEAGGQLWTDAGPRTPADAPRIAIAGNGLLEDAVRRACKL